MKTRIVNSLTFNSQSSTAEFPLPNPLVKIYKRIRRISELGSKGYNLCVILPFKELSAQYLSVLIALDQMHRDFDNYAELIYADDYKIGDRLLLNNQAVVEWAGRGSTGIKFKHHPYKRVVEVEIDFKDISQLQLAPRSKTRLSTLRTVMAACNAKNKAPIDDILHIQSSGNVSFIRNAVCLVGNYNRLTKCEDQLQVNGYALDDILKYERIDESGNVFTKRKALLTTNNLLELVSYLRESPNVRMILIDGAHVALDNQSDFIELLRYKLPTVVFTDLTEMDSFQEFGRWNFKYCYMDRYKLQSESESNPFIELNTRLNRFQTCNFRRVSVQDKDLHRLVVLVQSIRDREHNDYLVSLQYKLIGITNILARLSFELSEGAKVEILSRCQEIKDYYNINRLWLGEWNEAVEQAILAIDELIGKYASVPPPKATAIINELGRRRYGAIVCPGDFGIHYLRHYLKECLSRDIPEVVPIAEFVRVGAKRPDHILVTGWPRNRTLRELLNQNLYKTITLVFHDHENKYFNSLLRNCHNSIKAIGADVIGRGITKSRLYGMRISRTPEALSERDKSFNIDDYELRLENLTYQRFIAKASDSEALLAKRIDFHGDNFMYATESHRFLVVDNLFAQKKGRIFRTKPDQLKPGNRIVFIRTQREILAAFVESRLKTPQQKAVSVNASLWKQELRQYYESIGRDFKRLVSELRKHGCDRTEVTIRNWLLDEDLIGPRHDDDLLSIGSMIDNSTLLDKIDSVRSGITQMRSWRMSAADHLTKRIKASLEKWIDQDMVNTEVELPDLGQVHVLKVIGINRKWDQVELRYTNLLLTHEL